MLMKHLESHLLTFQCFVFLQFGFFMLEAILVFSKSSSLVPSVPRATKVKYHWVLQSLATLCAVGGFLAIVITKNMYNKPHFTSWHGFLGGLTVLFTCVQAMMGLTLIYPNLPLINRLKLALRKKLHALSGTIIFVFSCFVIILGFYSDWYLKRVVQYSWAWGLSVICPILLAATVNNQVAQAYIFRKL